MAQNEATKGRHNVCMLRICGWWRGRRLATRNNKLSFGTQPPIISTLCRLATNNIRKATGSYGSIRYVQQRGDYRCHCQHDTEFTTTYTVQHGRMLVSNKQLPNITKITTRQTSA